MGVCVLARRRMPRCVYEGPCRVVAMVVVCVCVCALWSGVLCGWNCGSSILRFFFQDGQAAAEPPPDASTNHHVLGWVGWFGGCRLPTKQQTTHSFTRFHVVLVLVVLARPFRSRLLCVFRRVFLLAPVFVVFLEKPNHKVAFGSTRFYIYLPISRAIASREWSIRMWMDSTTMPCELFYSILLLYTRRTRVPICMDCLFPHLSIL